MVRVKDDSQWVSNNEVHVEQWLEHIAKKGYAQQLNVLREACVLSQLTGSFHGTELGLSCFQLGLKIADILADIQVDVPTMMAGLIYPHILYSDLSLNDVEEQLGSEVSKLIRGVLRMGMLSQAGYSQGTHQIDNIRKMLLAMVDDVRVVVIKLAERLSVLRSMGHLSSVMQQQLARESMDIYAPLANRLGVGAIKWEMEDLAFRYLEPEVYRSIASGLKSKRIDRDRYVAHIIELLTQALQAHHLNHITVYGRSKHIMSIHRKMQQKHLSLDQIHDITALRVLVNTVEECYQVLGIVHALWKPVPEEFDDYISKPKANGYQSLHTAVIGPEQRLFEVQIRTYAMHDAAEMGVAAHWKYKEGQVFTSKPSHERRIEWLREVLAWHQELAQQSDCPREFEQEFLEDRVYVFTPMGDVLDIPSPATALDFAYHVHTQLGHRCRGIKINGVMSPLGSILKTGDRVEILTGKEAKPSRDWLNPHLNYVHTARAKAKILQWFKSQDHEQHCREGAIALERELKALGFKIDALVALIPLLHYQKIEDVYAAYGRGDLKLAQIVQRLQVQSTEQESFTILPKASSQKPSSDLKIEGVGQLLTSLAKCCQPLPGDDIIGYITIGRGVSIHKKDCPNIIHSSERQKQRLVQVSWQSKGTERYIVALMIRAFDRVDLLKDITSVMAVEKAHIYQLQTRLDAHQNETMIQVSVDVSGLAALARLIQKLSQLPNILEVRREHESNHS